MFWCVSLLHALKETHACIIWVVQKDEKQKVIIMFFSFVTLYVHFSYLILVKKINRIIHGSCFTSISNNSNNIYRYASSDNNMFLNAQGNHYVELVKAPKDSKTKLSNTLMLWHIQSHILNISPFYQLYFSLK